MMSNMSAISVKNLSFSFGDTPILHNCTFALKKGHIGTLVGLSGAGKTTLFKLLTGLISAQAGEIVLNGISIPEGYRQVSYMMQQDMLLPWRTVLGNTLLVAELGDGGSSAQLKEEALHLLHEVGMADYQNMYPHELSGGMRQRVALARALLQKRPLLLLDEPFGALDVALREQMHNLLRQICANHGTSILLVTHDFRDALSLSDQLFLLCENQIIKEWQLPAAVRDDGAKIGLLQKELQDHFRLHARSS